MREWILQVLIAFDRMVNVACFGKQGETISARAARNRAKKRAFGCLLCWILDKIEKDHCLNALATDKRDADIVQKEEI